MSAKVSLTIYPNQSISSAIEGLKVFKKTLEALLLKGLGTHGWVDVSLRFADVGLAMWPSCIMNRAH
jgi:hypothetical protein